jgi:hypothetical protein
MLLDGVAEHLLCPPANVMRLAFHPEGLAPRIVNGATLKRHMMERLQREIDITGDPVLEELRDEVERYPAIDRLGAERHSPHEVVVPFQIEVDAGLLSFITTTTVFGTAVDVTLNELAIESFFPADDRTARIIRQLSET